MQRRPTRHLGSCLRIALVLGLVLVTGGAVATARGSSMVELEHATRDYQNALGSLLVLQEREAGRAEASAQKYRGLFAEGLVSRRDAETAERAAATARARVEETRATIAEAGRVLVEANAMEQLLALPSAPPGKDRATADVLEYRGTNGWTLTQVPSLERFFSERFGRALPVSALGQTRVHDKLGFDHRNALDVAVDPESVEGRALLAYLRSQGVPFLAFRGAVTGASTGAHVHVGAPSPRKL